jgi:hypothetical protein
VLVGDGVWVDGVIERGPEVEESRRCHIVV